MDTVIEKISEIESAATGIMEDANERKKAFAKEMEERTAALMLSWKLRRINGLKNYGPEWRSR